MNAFLMFAPYFSQKALIGGLLKPSIAKSPPSYEYTLLSQCFVFKRIQSALIFFMPGLRDRFFEWSQNDITDDLAPIRCTPESQAKKSRVAPRLLQQRLQQCGAIMSINTDPGNTGRASTRSSSSPRMSQHLIAHQSAAMQAALMVRCQYSRASKSHFSRECLDHLKASLVPVQDVSV